MNKLDVLEAVGELPMATSKNVGKHLGISLFREPPGTFSDSTVKAFYGGSSPRREREADLATSTSLSLEA